MEHSTNESEEINWNDFAKVDIRVGTILEVNDFPKARRPAYQLKIDFGELGEKRSSAQITDLYKKEDLVGRQVLAVVNFPEKQIANFFSQCLVLGMVGDERGVILIGPDMKLENGLRLG